VSIMGVMESVPQTELDDRRRRGWAQKWDTYADGRTYRATRGTDFTGTCQQFRNTLYSAAARRSMSLEIKLDNENQTVTFRFTPRKAPQ
jgi:hypothetical protein